MTNHEFKNCPFCGEEIKSVAIKCKHCGSLLTQNNSTEKVGVKKNNKSTAFIIAGIIILSLLAVSFFAMAEWEAEREREREARIAIQKEIEASEKVDEETSGTISWDGGTYEGELSKGKPHGQGLWYHPKGGFVGEWEKGKGINGQLVMIEEDGTTHFFEVADGVSTVWKTTRPNNSSGTTQSPVSPPPPQESTAKPPSQEAFSYLGAWKNVETLSWKNPIAALGIRQSSGHYIFDMKFYDGSSMSVPATYKDGYFKIQMPGYTWSAYYDRSQGYLIMNFDKFRKAN